MPPDPNRAPARRTSASRGVVPVAAALALATLAGCASSTREAPVSALPRATEEYLLPPTSGWSGPLSADLRAIVEGGFTALRSGSADRALAAARDGLSRADSPPLRVLAAQALFVSGQTVAAREQVADWVGEQPDYTAAQLLAGRLAELADDPVAAQSAYRACAAQSPVAERGRDRTYARAISGLEARLGTAIAAGRLDEARNQVDRIEKWEPPGSVRAAEAVVRLAVAEEDPVAELAGLRILAAAGRNDKATLEREAVLELEVGDPEAGLAAFDRLVDRFPDDRGIETRRALAEVRWRVRLLPEEVQSLARQPELTRAEAASLLFWLVPGVRQAAGGTAQIATDILDDPRRAEIVRVLNRGLMTADPTLHRFEPERVLTRGEALASALAVIAQDPSARCVETLREHPAPSETFLCRTAGECGLLDDPEECLPGAPAGGGVLVELLGRAFAELGGA